MKMMTHLSALIRSRSNCSMLTKLRSPSCAASPGDVCKGGEVAADTAIADGGGEVTASTWLAVMVSWDCCWISCCVKRSTWASSCFTHTRTHTHTHHFWLGVLCFLNLYSSNLSYRSKVSKPSHYSTNRSITLLSILWFTQYIEGSRPEWCISSTIYSQDTPFWSETLDMTLFYIQKIYRTSSRTLSEHSYYITLHHTCLQLQSKQ